MAPHSYLEYSGDLYEGNFEEWKERLFAWMSYKFPLARYGEDRFRYLMPNEVKETAARICSTTCPAMLARVPDQFKTRGRQLLEALEDLATSPFRFLDLPAEIRNNIYEMTLPQVQWVYDGCRLNRRYDDRYYWDDESEQQLDAELKEMAQFPPILQVNSQIRTEAISIFYATTDFRMDFNRRMGREEFLEDRVSVDIWSQLIVGKNLKHLHRVKLWLDEAVEVFLEYSDTKGLEWWYISGSQRLMTKAGDELLNKHVAAIESKRKAKGLKGESIMMAILEDFGLWFTLHEKYVPPSP